MNLESQIFQKYVNVPIVTGAQRFIDCTVIYDVSTNELPLMTPLIEDTIIYKMSGVNSSE